MAAGLWYIDTQGKREREPKKSIIGVAEIHTTIPLAKKNLHGMGEYGMVSVWYGMVWYGMVWYGTGRGGKMAANAFLEWQQQAICVDHEKL